MAKRSGGGKRPRQATNRHYPRTARLNALLTEIIADYFERTDEDELGFMTITGAEVDADLNVCQVYVSTLEEPDPERDEIVLDVLASHRKSVQRVIAREAKLRKTPDVVFSFDPAVRAGARIDNVLAGLDRLPAADLPDPLLGDEQAEEPAEGDDV